MRKPNRSAAMMMAILGLSGTSATCAYGADVAAQRLAKPGTDSPQTVDLDREIAQLRSRITQIQAALDQNHQRGPFKAGAQRSSTSTDDEKGTSDALNKAATKNSATPAAAGCCSGMMGTMRVAPATSPTVPSDLPGFPGASHLYHVGATGFFLDHSATIELTVDQQASLKEIKENSIGYVETEQRRIDQAEVELWMLTSSDRPDSKAIEAKVREIEVLKSDQRIAFIRSVGEAARVLTDRQRAEVLGAGPSAPVQVTAPEGSTDSANPQEGTGSTGPETTPAGMSDDSMNSVGDGQGPTPQDNGEMGEM